MRRKISDFLVLFLFIFGTARCFLYFFQGNDATFKIFRYLNLSPLPIAFVHPSFFSKKEILLTYPSKKVLLDYMDSDQFFSNRSNYRSFMFMFDAPAPDREKTVQYLYCSHLNSLGIKEPTGEKLISVEFIYYYKMNTKRAKYICINS